VRTGVSELMQAWREAINFEQSMRERYLAAALLSDDPSIKSLFEYLAGEELKHKQLLEDEYQRIFEAEM